MDQIGKDVWYDMITHDDGVVSIGGNTVGIIGSMGAGKSTLVREACRQVRYSDATSIRDAPCKPEGVIYVARHLDSWLNFFNCGKPIRLFLYAPAVVHLCVSKGDKLISINSRLKPFIRYYTTIHNIIENLNVNGINIIYSPPTHEITDTIITILNRRIGQEPPKLGTPCDPALWWFDFISILVKTKNAGDHYTIVVDEAHRLFPPSPSGAWWHLIQDLCESLVDLRKSNLSFILATHETNMLDYRVVDRLNFFVWMRGIKPPRRLSIIESNIAGRCQRGQAIVEERGVRFGRAFTTRNLNAQPHVRAFSDMLDKNLLNEMLMRDRLIFERTGADVTGDHI